MPIAGKRRNASFSMSTPFGDRNRRLGADRNERWTALWSLDEDIGNAELPDHPGTGCEVSRHPFARERRWRASECERQKRLIGQVQIEGSAASQVLEQCGSRLVGDGLRALPSRAERAETGADALVLGGEEETGSGTGRAHVLRLYADSWSSAREQGRCAGNHAVDNWLQSHGPIPSEAVLVRRSPPV